MAVSFISGGNRRTQRKLLTCRKSLTNFINIMLYRGHLAWAEFKLPTLVVIGTDCTGSWISNYHTITTMTATQAHLKTIIILSIIFFFLIVMFHEDVKKCENVLVCALVSLYDNKNRYLMMCNICKVLNLKIFSSATSQSNSIF